MSLNDGDDEYHGPLAQPDIRLDVSMGAGDDIAYGGERSESIRDGGGAESDSCVRAGLTR